MCASASLRDMLPEGLLTIDSVLLPVPVHSKRKRGAEPEWTCSQQAFSDPVSPVWQLHLASRISASLSVVHLAGTPDLLGSGRSAEEPALPRRRVTLVLEWPSHTAALLLPLQEQKLPEHRQHSSQPCKAMAAAGAHRSWLWRWARLRPVRWLADACS